MLSAAIYSLGLTYITFLKTSCTVVNALLTRTSFYELAFSSQRMIGAQLPLIQFSLFNLNRIEYENWNFTHMTLRGNALMSRGSELAVVLAF